MITRILGLVVALLAANARAINDPRFDGKTGDLLPTVKIEAPTPASSDVETRVWVQFATPGGKPARDLAADSGISIEEVMPGQAAGIATPEAVDRARKAGVKILSAITLEQRFGSLDFPEKDSIYHNYGETKVELEKIAASAPDLVSLFSIGKSFQKNKDLFVLRLTRGAKGAEPSTKPGIVFLGTHHAREHLSTEIPLMLAKYLVDNRAQPEIARLLDTRDIYIIPMVNPDGVEYDISDGKYHMQRKNMAGVDLNRNYSYGWGGPGASDNPRDETYRGPSAFSEPETQAVKAFIEARKNLKVLLSYHTFSELILYPWGGTNNPIDDKPAHDAFVAMGAEMGKMTGYTPQQSSALYIASGDTCDWAWGSALGGKKIFPFTFELTPKSMWGGGFYPGPEAIATTFQANIRPALYLIDLADNPLRATRGQSAFAVTPAEPKAGEALQ